MVLDIHVGEKKKKNYDPLPLTIHKIDFKWLSDLNITAESFKFLGEKKRISVNPGVGKDFSDKANKALTVKK